MDTFVPLGIGGIAIIMAIVIAALVRNPKVAAGIAALMAAQLFAAESGILSEFYRRPPPFAILMLVTLALTVFLAFSSAGDSAVRRHSIPVLIAIQVFRLPLELVMHQAAADGIMPPQMTWTGLNFDILSGALALPAAWFASRGSRFAAVAWNTLGSLLLAAIITIAFISTPAIAAFGPDKLNTFVANAPYVWLPGILVPAALLGHILLWRKLSRP